MQRFYIVPYPVEQSILNIIVEAANTLRINTSKTKAVIKLWVGDSTEYPQLNGYTVYNNETILEPLSAEEWQPIEADF